MTTDLSRVPTICQPHSMEEPVSIWVGDNPVDYMTPRFLLQISVASTVTGTMKFLLEPLGQTSFVSQMIGGILAGPTLLGQSSLFIDHIFAVKSLQLFENFQYFGCMFYLFLVGVKMDLSMVKRSGKKAWVIGVSCFIIPLTLTLSLAYIIKKTVTMEPDMLHSIIAAAALTSLSSFHVIACFLDDLNLLNSELGRLATSSSMISGICSYVSSFITLTVLQSLSVNKPHTFLWILLSSFTMMLIIVYLIRPFMCWMVRQTPEGQTIGEGYLFLIFVLILLCSFVGEIIGQHFLVGPMILGLAVPVGPPLGSALEDKLECFVSCILLPVYILANSTRIDFFEIKIRNFVIVEVLVFFSFLGKLLGTMLPALYCKMPYQDALLLGLIMNAQGVIDMQICARAMGLKVISVPVYALLMLSMVILTGIISPIVHNLYCPSRRYMPYRRRTIQHIKNNVEFRILTCVYFEENVPTIINLLEASNPTRYSPICIYLVHLVELQGRASPILITHKKSKLENPSSSNPSAHIVNAFKLYETHNEGTVSVHSFTAISPYATMHDDICTLGLDRRTYLLIIPFHKQGTVTSTLHSIASIRNVNRNVLSKAPCSVGILIDRGTTTTSTTIYACKPKYSVGVIFLGDADDREALSYAARMGERRNIDLTVVRFILSGKQKIDQSSNEKRLDNDIINDFRLNCTGIDRIKYREEIVADGVAMVSVIRTIENSVDIMMVGRQHGKDSAELLKGLEEWNENPELGIVGDFLATSDSNTRGSSILVVQQQASVTSAILPDSPKYCCLV